VQTNSVPSGSNISPGTVPSSSANPGGNGAITGWGRTCGELKSIMGLNYWHGEVTDYFVESFSTEINITGTLSGNDSSRKLRPTRGTAGSSCDTHHFWQRVQHPLGQQLQQRPHDLRLQRQPGILQRKCDPVIVEKMSLGYDSLQYSFSDTPQGDSGGPLSVGSTIYGLTSWGVSGCGTNFPSVYAKNGAVSSWICQTTGNGAQGC